MPEKLKPCPFCRGKASFKSNLWGGCWVTCDGCGCTLGMKVINETRCAKFKTTAEATKAWNARGKR